MSLEPGLVEPTEDRFQKLTVLIGRLRPTDDKTGRMFHVVYALGDSAKTNYLTLRKALDTADQTLSAWSCRNLLELSIFTQFVLMSKNNADQFVEDRLIDGHEMAVALRELKHT